MILGMSGTKLPQHHNCNKIPKVDAGRVAADRKKGYLIKYGCSRNRLEVNFSFHGFPRAQ